MRAARLLAAPLGLTAVNLAPALTSVPHLRRSLLPALSGRDEGLDVALTYDDGPDPASTPAFLDLLDRYGVTATFFLLGDAVEPNAGLVAEMAAAGHELAVHGWDHQCLALKRPGVLADELTRTRDAVEQVTGVPVVHYRPPYGVMTLDGLLATRRAGLRTVLWSAWGRDWSSRATPDSVVRKVSAALRRGGTVLLHDTDRTSAPGSWHTTLAASERLLDTWQERGWAVGSLRRHTAGRAPAGPMLAG